MGGKLSRAAPWRLGGSGRFTQEFPNFAGGYTERTPEQAPPNAFVVGTNVRLSLPDAAVMTRSGSQAISNAVADGAAGAIQGGTVWNNTHVVMVSGTIYQSASLTPTTTWNNRSGAFSNNSTVYAAFAVFINASGTDSLYIADGAGTVGRLTSVTVSTRVSGAVSASITRIAVYNERLFGITGSDNTLYFSGLDNGDSLGDATNGGGSINIRQVNTSKLIGLLPVGQTLFLFFENSIGRFTGWSQDDIDLEAGTRGLSTSVGLHRIQSQPVGVENFGFFVGSDLHIYRITEVGLDDIGLPITVFSEQGLLSYGVTAWPYRGEIIFQTGASLYIYNYKLSAWCGVWTDGGQLTNGQRAGWTSILSGVSYLFFPASTGSHVYLCDSDNFNARPVQDGIPASGTATGSDITATISTRPLLGSPFDSIATRYIYAYARCGATGTAMTITQNVANVSTALATFTSGSGFQIYRAQGGGNAGNIVQLGGIIKTTGVAFRALYSDDPMLQRLMVEGFLYPTRGESGPVS